ncbi:MAG: hypothetical protein IJ498_01675 [Akkermansia sp.]|nr:hypothetical protein [Akkermansia sp.]
MTIHSHDILSSPHHPFISVHGITCQRQADCAVAFGARCLVFDFQPAGLHRISVEQAAHIASANVARLGSFATDDLAAIRETMLTARLDFAILHGPCAPADAARVLGAGRILRAFSGAAVTQEALDSWSACCAGFRIFAEDAAQVRGMDGLRIPLPWILSPGIRGGSFGSCRPDGMELAAQESRLLLREVLAVQSV